MERYFEWNDLKAVSNFRKHGVSFEIALEVFDDPLAKSVQDRIANGEYRWQTIGMAQGSLLKVAHTIREDKGGSEIVRIISARHAEPRERRGYGHG
jgi:uncharacterized DUF497 family protein